MNQIIIKTLTYFTHLIFLIFVGLYFIVNSDKTLKTDTYKMNDIFENQDNIVSNKNKPYELDLEILPMPNLKYTNKENKKYKILVENYPNRKSIQKNQFKERTKPTKIIPLKYEIKERENVKIKTLKNYPFSNSKKFNLVKIEPLKPKKIPFQNADSSVSNNKYGILRTDEQRLSKLEPLEITNLFEKTLERKKENINFLQNPDNYLRNLRSESHKKTISKDQIKNIQQNGNNVLKTNQNFQLEFLWPINIERHDKIFNILDKCLESETVLIDNNNIIYGINGEIKRHTLRNDFSKIIRIPNNVHSVLEKNKIKKIKNKYFTNSSGKHLRLYKKYVDNYIIGSYLNLAEKNNIKSKDMKIIRGKFNIIEGNLYLENLMINSKNFDNKILLSSLYNNCTV